jgi:hypothetical protein
MKHKRFCRAHINKHSETGVAVVERQIAKTIAALELHEKAVDKWIQDMRKDIARLTELSRGTQPEN